MRKYSYKKDTKFKCTSKGYVLSVCTLLYGCVSRVLNCTNGNQIVQSITCRNQLLDLL